VRNRQVNGQLELLLLAVLARGAAHGYGVIGALADQSGGRFDLPEGTVYPALHRLEQLGLVSSSWSDGEGRRRRVYRITGAGSRALAERSDQWRELATGVNAVLGLGLVP
jgi:DNA-binding PadR family transcriptional regulator